MAIQTKPQLSASNAVSFPDNTTGFITPALLRNFNTSSIDSYASLSGSNIFVGNQVITGSVIATGSITATSFTGSLQGTSSFANNATSASYALVAESANTIGSTTFSGVQTYTFSQNKVVGSASGWNNTITQKFITGSFQVVSGSYQKFMSIAQSGSDDTTWRANGTIMGSVVSQVELAIASFGFNIRTNSLNFFQTYTDPAINSATSGLLRPEYSASFNTSTNALDLYARTAYNNTGSMLVEMTLNFIQSGSTPPTPNISYTFY